MKIEIHLDDEKTPRQVLDPPAKFQIDTTQLEDGPHTLHVRAIDDDGSHSVQEFPFSVHNGPGIALFGLAKHDVVSGNLPLIVNAFSGQSGVEFEPVRAETPAPIPTWAWVLCLVVATWGMWYSAVEIESYRTKKAQASGEAGEPGGTSVENPAAALGDQVYGSFCAACHQLTGEGVPGVFPPLKGDPVVTASDPSEHIKTVLNGLIGKEIGGIVYASPMPAFSSQLTDEQIAAVIGHERTNWGNSAPLVSPEQVKSLR